MPKVAQVIGGAGTGKTTFLLDLMTKVIDKGYDPMEIGFVSFTRAARREASSRAGDKFGIAAKQLEDDGWFRTLHSVCYRCIGVSSGQLLTDDRDSRKWLQENLSEEVSGTGESSVEEITEFANKTDADRALALWSTARSRLEPLEQVWEVADRISDRTPSLASCLATVERYEQAKRLDDRLDFTDTLGQFAGFTFHPTRGAEERPPIGEVPRLPVWFFDEQQDTSALLDHVCRRLCEPAKWVYVVGDPFQSIYGWAGADAGHFLAWEHMGKRRIMPKSYRCPKPIHELGERILAQSSDYWDRGIEAADHEGGWSIEAFGTWLLDDVDPREEWLLLARTNYHAQRLARRLQECSVPWRPTRGVGGWEKQVYTKALKALHFLASGLAIDGEHWSECIRLIPAKCKDGPLLTHGAKADWNKHGKERHDRIIRRETIVEHGGAELLEQLLTTGGWESIVDGGKHYKLACERWGQVAVDNPQVRVGTIHSVKGAEADNVLWLTSSTAAITRGCEEREQYDEECRVSYVAATRARKRLIVARELNERHQPDLPI